MKKEKIKTKTPRLGTLKTELRSRHGKLINEISCHKLGYSLQVWTLEPGIIVIIQIWFDDSGWELYMPASHINSIPATWEALDNFRDKVRGFAAKVPARASKA